MEYLLTIEVRQDGIEGHTEDAKEAYADMLLVVGKGNDFSTGVQVSTALQALIPAILAEAYQKLDEKINPEQYGIPVPTEHPVE